MLPLCLPSELLRGHGHLVPLSLHLFWRHQGGICEVEARVIVEMACIGLALPKGGLLESCRLHRHWIELRPAKSTFLARGLHWKVVAALDQERRTVMPL